MAVTFIYLYVSIACIYSCVSYSYLSIKMKGSVFKFEKSSCFESFRPLKLITKYITIKLPFPRIISVTYSWTKTPGSWEISKTKNSLDT